MNKPLTGRERVTRMFERRDHDRVPRHESFWPETITRWQGEGLNGNEQSVLDLLDGDFHSLCWLWPECFPGSQREVSVDEETRVIRDGQGKLVRYWRNKSGTPRYGQDLAFFGNVDVMTMITNDLAVIEEEIREKVTAGKATRGYVYHSDHSVPPQVSWKTYQAIIQLVERYGSYTK